MHSNIQFFIEGYFKSKHILFCFFINKFFIIWETDFNKSIDNRMLIIDNSSVHVVSV